MDVVKEVTVSGHVRAKVRNLKLQDSDNDVVNLAFGRRAATETDVACGQTIRINHATVGYSSFLTSIVVTVNCPEWVEMRLCILTY